MSYPGAARAFALAALVVLPGALAQTPQAWDEVAGSGARTGAAFLPTATLDVLSHRDLFGDDLILDVGYSKGLVSTPHGLVSVPMRRDDGSCALTTVPRAGAEPEARAMDECFSPALTAYDRVNDRLLVCVNGGSDDRVLQSRDAASGDVVWGVRPAELGAAGSGSFGWRCQGTALDPVEGVAYVALWGADPARDLVTAAAYVIRVRLADGVVDWDRPIATADLQAAKSTGVSVTSSTGTFIPYGISLTDHGLVVSGRSYCACGKGDPVSALNPNAPPIVEGAVAWLDHRDGSMEGAAFAETDEDAAGDGPSRRFLGQWWASTAGPLAAFLVGERVLVVNPAEREPVREARFAGIETGPGFFGVIPSAWWGDSIVVPVSRSVTALDPVTLAPKWSWTAGNQWVVSGLILLPPTDALVLVASNENGTDASTMGVIHRLDLRTGSELQRIPLPGTLPMDGGLARARFQPLDDGTLLLYAMDGGLFTLGPADPALVPGVTVSDAYPATGAPVTVTVQSPRADANYTIAWGDGTLHEGGSSWTHRYGDEATRTVRVTVVYADGRTATSETLVRVGATRPPDLTTLQRAFAPENQDLTFGVIGIALTAAGAGVALLARRRRQSRLREDLAALDRIRAQGRNDPESAVLALGAFRGKLFADLEAGRVDDAQFHTLDTRADAAFGALRTRLLGPLAGRLTADFRHALDVVLHDGRVDADELAALRGALDEERHVTPAERERLLALVERLGGGAEP